MHQFPQRALSIPNRLPSYLPQFSPAPMAVVSSLKPSQPPSLPEFPSPYLQKPDSHQDSLPAASLQSKKALDPVCSFCNPPHTPTFRIYPEDPALPAKMLQNPLYYPRPPQMGFARG